MVTNAVARLADGRAGRDRSASRAGGRSGRRPRRTAASARRTRPRTRRSPTAARVVDACSSRPIVGSATLRIELSSISNRNTADRPARATHASRSDRGERAWATMGEADVTSIRLDYVTKFSYTRKRGNADAQNRRTGRPPDPRPYPRSRHRLFLERGYDTVTVAEVARAAGVSSVTVFNHFPRKEDLFLDRTDRCGRASFDRPCVTGLATPTSWRRWRREPPSFPRTGPALGRRSSVGEFFRTVAQSPALIARAREIAAELQETLVSSSTRPGFLR